MNNRQVCYDLFFVYLHLFELKRCGYWEGVFI